MAAIVEVKGLKELKAALAELPRNVARNALRGSVRAAAAVVRDEAQVKAPVGETGTLKRSIYLKHIPERSNDVQQTFYVGVRKGKQYQNLKTKGGKDRSMDAYYAAWVEYGHWSRPAGKHRMTKRATSYSTHLKGDMLANRLPRGYDRATQLEAMASYGKIRWIPAKPYMRPAWDAKQDASLQALRDYLAKRIYNEVRK